MTIPHGPRGRKIILDFPDVPEKRRGTSRARYILTAGFLIASGFFAMALLIKPAIQHNQVAESATPKKAADAPANPNQDSVSPDQSQSDSTVVHNGVTVVTPHLLVPVVSDAAAAATEESAALTKITKPTVAKNRDTHRSARAASPGPLTAPWFNPTKQVVRY